MQRPQTPKGIQANRSVAESLSPDLSTQRPILRPPQIIGQRYEIRSKLGEGGTSEVWQAFDMKLRMDVALKAVRLNSIPEEEFVETFRSEVRTARGVISPNVCRLYDLVIEEQQELISMEYVDGITLIDLLLEKGPMAFKDAADVAGQFLAGLEAIHQAGFVHCDLKPENIMITRAGRVVVMDFGIAKHMTQIAETVSGTVPYMAPERLSGAAADARSDIYSAGVILAEMIQPQGIVTEATRREIWDAVHRDPLELADSPWKMVISRAVATNPDHRYPSAAALRQALEEATQHIEMIGERSPYPGLSSFLSADAQYFFGRELEIESAVKKLRRLHLMALVGPSGAGKTSFLRAGLIPAFPPDWSCIFCAPGDSPFLNLGQALVPELSKNTEAMQKMLQFEDPSVALEFLNEWRKKHAEGVLMIDRFEELFTLNGPEVQSRFTELVGRAALESDVRVLLSMRDDFLLRCQDSESLNPIFSELTPLNPLTGSALRRALVQPALKSGYRFEGETLVDEILLDVEKEKGALPLMAFAASRLWQKRNVQTAQLTREAYKSIGGVAGALAQHAEAAMERIGTERQPIVREIFRNLITAENTRAARDTEELLSVFPEKDIAREVLRTLIDARLLTSFEAPAAEGEKPRSRIEIIHESLLSAWPRLVRWQTQDAASAQLRDQLRQAAHLWEQKSRSGDLLWTGTAVLEFEAWRQSYPGRLSSAEEAFAEAMLQRANKKRIRQRIAVAATFVVLLIIVGVIANFWRNATLARNDAVSEAKRAEAGKLIVIGRSQPEPDRATRLAYVLASLEVADTSEAREFAHQVLSQGPPAFTFKTPDPVALNFFSPDDKWFVAVTFSEVRVLPRDGSSPLVVTKDCKGVPQFTRDGEFIVWISAENPRAVKIYSVTQKKIVRTVLMQGYTTLSPNTQGDIFLVTDTKGEPMTGRGVWGGRWAEADVRILGAGADEPQFVGHWIMEGVGRWVIHSETKSIAYEKSDGVYIRSMNASGIGAERLVARTVGRPYDFLFLQNGNEIAICYQDEVRIWSLVPGATNPTRTFKANGDLFVDPNGRFLTANSDVRLLAWDLTAPENAEPFVFEHPREETPLFASFDHQGRWIAISWQTSTDFFPLTHTDPYVLRGTGKGSFNIRFTPDGKSLINGDREGIHMWNTPGEKQAPVRTLWKPLSGSLLPIDVDPSGKYVLAGTNDEGAAEGAYVISIADGKAVPLKRGLPGRIYDSVSFSPDGRFAASVAVHGPPQNHGIEIWDLQAGGVRAVEQSKGKASFCVKYSPDGSLFSGDSSGNLYQWNLKDAGKMPALPLKEDELQRVWKIGQGIVTGIAITKDGRYVAAASSSATQWGEVAAGTSEFVIHDLKQNKTFPIVSHGNRVFRVAIDPGGTKLVTGDLDGLVRVGPMNGDAPHRLLGHESQIGDVVVHPGGKWIASTEFNNAVIRLWPMPEGNPMEALPHAELLKRLRSFTNVRVVADSKSNAGYRIVNEPFPGWEKLPSW